MTYAWSLLVAQHVVCGRVRAPEAGPRAEARQEEWLEPAAVPAGACKGAPAVPLQAAPDWESASCIMVTLSPLEPDFSPK